MVRRLGSDLRGVIPNVMTLMLAAWVAVPPAATRGPAAPRAATADASGGPRVVVEYDLGETMIVQERFPADSRFRNMPIRLNGVIAVPHEGGGPFPVILILHGTHPGCPEIDHVDRWPCDPADERPNYRGFGYLAEHLAANGYVALSVNINAENTFGFGEPTPGERLRQIVDKHLRALATASAGGENKFGADLNGKADVRRLALVGHSRGGRWRSCSHRAPSCPRPACSKSPPRLGLSIRPLARPSRWASSCPCATRT
jgi:hypothetical protein